MSADAYVDRLIDLTDPRRNVLLSSTQAELEDAVASGDAESVRSIDGQFAAVRKVGETVYLARSIGRPLRYFLAKKADGPCLYVAERIEEIRDRLEEDGLVGQFHPSYTRMVPAHHVVELQLVGCPDPEPTYRRYFDPPADALPADRDAIGRAYVGAVASACSRWLEEIDPDEPIGVLFSGGIDSGALFLILRHLLLERGEAPTRLKAFTLASEEAPERSQALEFLDRLGMTMFLELIEADGSRIDYREAIAVLEDYKPLDVQAGAMTLALCRGIRERYPEWRYLVDGDGGDENLKDYPIEDDGELTIRSVLGNQMLYHEGWGVHALKHSLTYSGGQSRGHVRTYMPARTLGFESFSPYSLPDVIEVSEGIPFVELTDWQPEKLYALKGEIVRRGVEAVTGVEMPVFEKRRFQRGAVSEEEFEAIFPADEQTYRRAFRGIYQ